jgi:hypothetical protein
MAERELALPGSSRRGGAPPPVPGPRLLAQRSMQQHGSELQHALMQALSGQGGSERRLVALAATPGDAEAGATGAAWPARRVVFLNDVYFCARDVVRLLQHDADVACGLDFDRPTLEQAPLQAELPQAPRSARCSAQGGRPACGTRRRASQVQRRLLRRQLRERHGVPELLGGLLGYVAPVLRAWRSQAAVRDAFRVSALARATACSPHAPGPLCQSTAPAPTAGGRAGRRAAGLLRHVGRARHERQPLPEAGTLRGGARRAAAHRPRPALPCRLLLERPRGAHRGALPAPRHPSAVRPRGCCVRHAGALTARSRPGGRCPWDPKVACTPAARSRTLGRPPVAAPAPGRAREARRLARAAGTGRASARRPSAPCSAPTLRAWASGACWSTPACARCPAPALSGFKQPSLIGLRCVKGLDQHGELGLDLCGGPTRAPA